MTQVRGWSFCYTRAGADRLQREAPAPRRPGGADRRGAASAVRDARSGPSWCWPPCRRPALGPVIEPGRARHRAAGPGPRRALPRLPAGGLGPLAGGALGRDRRPPAGLAVPAHAPDASPRPSTAGCRTSPSTPARRSWRARPRPSWRRPTSPSPASTSCWRGERGAFSLCRPPGHHAALDLYGGYCFVNNASAAAQALLRRRDGPGRGASTSTTTTATAPRTSSGTGATSWSATSTATPARSTRSSRGTPTSGATGTGSTPTATTRCRWARGPRRGSPPSTTRSATSGTSPPTPWSCRSGWTRSRTTRSPASSWTSSDYPVLGARLADLGVPTLFVMEGGYAVEAIGTNVAGVLTGFESPT